MNSEHALVDLLGIGHMPFASTLLETEMAVAFLRSVRLLVVMSASNTSG